MDFKTNGKLETRGRNLEKKEKKGWKESLQ
jgi:hypothetical protein